MTKIELLYAKLSFRLDTNRRMAVCRKLASLLRNNFTLMDALGRIERAESRGGTKPNEPFAIVMRQWQKNLERGMPLHEATRGWIPITETMLLTVGDVSKLDIALANIDRVMTGTQRIRRAMIGAIAYPLFLFALTVGIIIMVGLYLVPPLSDAAGGDMVWRGMAASLIAVADFAQSYWYAIVATFLAIIAIVWISLPNWAGYVRIVADKLPPYNIYKIYVSVGWMMSLSSMVSAGGSIPVALKTLADNSTPYLRSILESTLRYITNGENLGMALIHSGRDFPNREIAGDLAIYSDMTGFDQNINRIANDYLDESVRKMEAISSAMNSIGILVVSAIIGWVVLGTFQMQDQITAALT